jgi:hypothetical protein
MRDVLSYEVLLAQPRSPEDAIAKQIEGSVAAASQAQADRAKIRTVLGSSTMQQLILK